MLVYPRYNNFEVINKVEKKLRELSNSIFILDLPLIQISSTMIRKRIRKKLNVYGFVPDEIIPYLEEIYVKKNFSFFA